VSVGSVGPLTVWLLAIRPKTLPAAAAPVVLATGIAASRGMMSPLPAAAALAGALLIQIATNLANDVFDHRKGTDTEARLGPTRVVQAGLLAPRKVLRATLWVLAAATLVGAYLVWVGGVPILLIGLASLVCALAYSGGPFPLASHGLGDLFVFVFFGLVAVAGTVWVQARVFTADLLLAGAGIGALTTAILVVNNLRDIPTDARAGKRTLAVRLGVRGSRIEYSLLLGLAAAVPLAGVLAFDWTPWTLVGLVAFGRAFAPARAVWTFDDPRELNAALGGTARVVAWYGGLMAVGFLMGARGA
jgi:1,4-dihydroxy-2-naphthoate octaprenyltransferase